MGIKKKLRPEEEEAAWEELLNMPEADPNYVHTKTYGGTPGDVTSEKFLYLPPGEEEAWQDLLVEPADLATNPHAQVYGRTPGDVVSEEFAYQALTPEQQQAMAQNLRRQRLLQRIAGIKPTNPANLRESPNAMVKRYR